MRTSNEKGKYRCLYKGCSAICSYPDSLKRHIQTIHPKRLFQCKYCNEGFRRAHFLVAHLSKVHSKSGKDLGIYLCKVKDCRKVFDDKESLNQHKKIHPSIKYKCEKCNKEFGYRKNMLVHMKTAHIDIDFYKIFECKFCNLSCSSPSKLKKHLLSHTGERPYACAVEGCQKRYMCQSHLNVHLRLNHIQERKHRGNQEKHFRKCKICGKIFKNSIFLKNHISCHIIKKNKIPMNNIEKLKNNKCDNKSEAIKEQNNKIHDNNKIINITKMNSSINNTFVKQKPQQIMKKTNYNCTLCDEKCKTRRNFIIHQRFHAVESLVKEMEIFDNQLKVYKCNICSKINLKKSEHTEHLFTKHFTEQFYDCNVCCRVFFREDDLSEHLTKHFDSDDNNLETENEFSLNQKIQMKHENFNNTKKSISNLNKNSIKNHITKDLSISITRNKKIDNMAVILKNSFKTASNPSSSASSLSPPIENVIKNQKDFKYKKLSVKLKKINLDKIPLQQIKTNRININSLLNNKKKIENTINDNNQQSQKIKYNRDTVIKNGNHINIELSNNSQIKDSFDINDFVEVLVIHSEEEENITDTEINNELVEPILFDTNSHQQNDQNSQNQMNKQSNNFDIETEIQINDDNMDDNLNDLKENRHIVIESQIFDKKNVKEKNKNQIVNENVSNIPSLRLLSESSHAGKVSINHQQEYNVDDEIILIESPQIQNKNQSDICAKSSSSLSVKNLPSEIVSSSNNSPLSFIRKEQIPIIEILDDDDDDDDDYNDDGLSKIKTFEYQPSQNSDQPSQNSFSVEYNNSEIALQFIKWNKFDDRNKLVNYLKTKLRTLYRNLDEFNIPIEFEDIIFLSTTEYLHELAKYDFSAMQLQLIRDIRKRSRKPLSQKRLEFERELSKTTNQVISKQSSNTALNLNNSNNIPYNDQQLSRPPANNILNNKIPLQSSNTALNLNNSNNIPYNDQQLSRPPTNNILNNKIPLQSSNTALNLNNSNNILYNDQQLSQSPVNILNNNSSVAVVPSTSTPPPLAVNCMYPITISFQHPQNGYEITKEIPIQLNTTIPNYNQINTNLNLIQYPSYSSTKSSSWSLPSLVPLVTNTTEPTISPINYAYIIQQQQQQPFN